MRIAINQPYFIPYAGFFRLFDVDLFVYLDDAQFSKQSYVNRNRLTRQDGTTDWLSLPLAKHSLHTQIKDIQFAKNAVDAYESELRRFKIFREPVGMVAHAARVAAHFVSPVKAITEILEIARGEIRVNCPTMRSSDLPVTSGLGGVDKIVAICKYLKVTEYVNASGGAGLYKSEEFSKHGIKLKILEPYQGNMLSMAERLEFEDPRVVGKEIQASAKFIS